MALINGGYYIKARQIQDSKIAHKPPHVREIWDWLIKEVNHKDNGMFKRGQTMRSIKDIQNGLSWYAGYRKMTYSKSKCEGALEWLRNEQMIETTKTTRGLVITVLKYDTYQTPKNYETNNEPNNDRTRTEQPADTINKNDKNNKNEKKEELTGFDLIFQDWFDYKKTRRESYKSEKSITAFKDKLRKLSNNNESTAREIIEQSMANNWAGIFELKQDGGKSKPEPENSFRSEATRKLLIERGF